MSLLESGCAGPLCTIDLRGSAKVPNPETATSIACDSYISIYRCWVATSPTHRFSMGPLHQQIYWRPHHKSRITHASSVTRACMTDSVEPKCGVGRGRFHPDLQGPRFSASNQYFDFFLDPYINSSERTGTV